MKRILFSILVLVFIVFGNSFGNENQEESGLYFRAGFSYVSGFFGLELRKSHLGISAGYLGPGPTKKYYSRYPLGVIFYFEKFYLATSIIFKNSFYLVEGREIVANDLAVFLGFRKMISMRTDIRIGVGIINKYSSNNNDKRSQAFTIDLSVGIRR